jgi:serine/threonine protein phosphatase PrpC
MSYRLAHLSSSRFTSPSLVAQRRVRGLEAANSSWATHQSVKVWFSSNSVSSLSLYIHRPVNSRCTEVIVASALALLTTSVLVLAFPTTTATSQDPHNHTIPARNSPAELVVSSIWPEPTKLVSHGGGGNDGDGKGTNGILGSLVFADVAHSIGEHCPSKSPNRKALSISAAATSASTTENPASSIETATVVQLGGNSVTRGSVRQKPYDVSVRALQGGRMTMEDEYVVANGGRFAGVFDGHGGGGVSQRLRVNLYNKTCAALARKQHELTDASSVLSHVAALRDAFDEMEQDVLEDDGLQYQGSTAVVVVVHESEEGKRTLLSANVGDSRAILSRNQNAVDLTRDHKPNDDREKARILAMGETIEWDLISKVHRVRNLSLSRAIGDRYAKPIVSGQVEIQHYPVQEQDDEFFLLASDGLWDVMTSQDVISYVHRQMEQELDRESLHKDDRKNYKLVLRRNMAKFVAREAMRRGSADNVCVLMVWLNDMGLR